MMELKEKVSPSKASFALSDTERCWGLRVKRYYIRAEEDLHFKKRGDLSGIRAKQSTRAGLSG